VRIPWLTARWERAEARAEEAEGQLAEAKVEAARIQRAAEESREFKRINGFTEAIRSAMGVTDGGTAPRPGHRHA
jgi:hypothetical protein